MSLTVTVALLLLGVAMTAFCGWRGARPPDLRRGPRMIPWRPLMALSAVFVLLMLVHIANLAGIQTGRR